MSLLKSLADSLDNESVMVEKKRRQLKTNPASIPFNVNFPVIQTPVPSDYIPDSLVATCRSIEDVQKRETNVRADMTDWYMHESDTDFANLSEFAVSVGNDNSPSKVFLMPYDCWSASYSKGDHTVPHDHWPAIWSWVYNLDCCAQCSPLIFDDASQSVPPVQGMMIMFPGWVKHSVAKQQCDHKRIIIAGNLGLNPYWMDKSLTLKKSNTVSRYKEIINHNFDCYHDSMKNYRTK